MEPTTKPRLLEPLTFHHELHLGEVLSQPVSERTPSSDPQPRNVTPPDGEVLDVAPKQKGLFAEVRP